MIFASGNQGKLKEVKAILEAEGIEIKCLKDFKPVDEPVEDGLTFLDNAKIKAIYYYQIFKTPVLCDDSGLMVDALNGEPGVYSARYANVVAHQDTENIKKLLHNLHNISNRTASFVCTMVYFDGTNLYYTEGKLEGQIVDVPRGSNGFGYDPVFMPNGYDQTIAELDSDLKNKISHRHHALIKMERILKEKAII